MRQLYTEGYAQEADALLDQCMTCQGNESDSSTSTSEWRSGNVRRLQLIKHNPPDVEPCHQFTTRHNDIILHLQEAQQNTQLSPTLVGETPPHDTPTSWHIPHQHHMHTDTPPDHHFTKQTLHPTQHSTAIARVLKNSQNHTDLQHSICIHVDGGANRSVTNNPDILTGYKNIKRYPLSGVSGDGPAIHCTGMGYLPWKSDTSETVYIKCYYSKDAAETIVSPTDVVANHITDVYAWGQHCNIDTGKGWLKLYYRDGAAPITYHLVNQNNLWYHHSQGCTLEDYK